MFNYTEDLNSEALDAAIAKLLTKMKDLPGGSDEYAKHADNLVKLVKLKNDAIKLDNESDKLTFDREIENNRFHNEENRIRFDRSIEEEKLRIEKEKLRSWKPSTDALVGAAASIVGILFVLHYEKLNVVTSKAIGFVGKMK
jgi:hypothetical protein